MNMFKKLVLATWLFTPFFCFAKNLVILSGKVVNDSNIPITNAQITLGKYATNTSPRGEFKLEIPEQIVYSLDVKIQHPMTAIVFWGHYFDWHRCQNAALFIFGNSNAKLSFH